MSENKKLAGETTKYPWEGCETGTWMWHIHHDGLLEILTEPASARAVFIRGNKPAHEIETRLMRMGPIRNVDRIPVVVREAKNTLSEMARQAYGSPPSTAFQESSSEVWGAYSEATSAYYKACRTHRAEIEALHAEECPDCPWDGKTLFPTDEENT